MGSCRLTKEHYALRCLFRIRCHTGASLLLWHDTKGNFTMKKFNIRTLSTLSMLVAVSIVLSRLLGFYVTVSLRVSFEYFPIILAGIIFGPIAGAIVGGLSDFLGAALFSGMGFFPPLIVGPILAGLLAGIIAKYLFKDRLDKWWKHIVLVITVDLLCNLLWGTYALSLLFGTPFITYLALRAPIKICIAIADAHLVFAVYKALRSVLIGLGYRTPENNFERKIT